MNLSLPSNRLFPQEGEVDLFQPVGGPGRPDQEAGWRDRKA